MSFALDNRTPIAGGYFQANINNVTAQTIADMVGTIPQGANVCLIQVDEDNEFTNPDIALRYREDGTAPTSAFGFVIGQGDYRELTNRPQIDAIKLISPQATSVKVNIQFYKA